MIYVHYSKINEIAKYSLKLLPLDQIAANQHVDCYMGAYYVHVIQHLTRYSPFSQKYVLSTISINPSIVQPQVKVHRQLVICSKLY